MSMQKNKYRPFAGKFASAVILLVMITFVSGNFLSDYFDPAVDYAVEMSGEQGENESDPQEESREDVLEDDYIHELLSYDLWWVDKGKLASDPRVYHRNFYQDISTPPPEIQA